MFTGRFEPGAAISIRRIAAEYGVSVIPARDALRALVAEGVLEFRDRRTIAVPVLSGARHADVLFARLALECELARRAAERFGPADLKELRGIDARLDAAIASDAVEDYVHGNHAFHFHIYWRADSPTLLRLVETLWLQYAPSMRRVCRLGGARGIEHDWHRAAMAALADRDPNRVAAAIGADIRQGMDFIAAHGALSGDVADVVGAGTGTRTGTGTGAGAGAGAPGHQSGYRDRRRGPA